MKNLIEWNKHDDFVVTKSSYLTCLIDVFRYKQVTDLEIINRNYKNTGEVHLELGKFRELVLDYDPTLQFEWIEQLYEEARQINDPPESVEIHEFAEIVVRYGIGGYGLGVFAIRELLDIMSDRNIVVDLDFE